MRGHLARTAGAAARGFTLVELMIVVAIIGLLASMAVPGYQKMTMRAKQRERIVHFNGFRRALIDEFRTNGRLPKCNTQMVGPTTPGLWAPFNTSGDPNGCFRKIPYSIDGGTRYRWYLSIDSANNSFLLYAIGDANRNGTWIYYYLSCQPDEVRDCKKNSVELYIAVPGTAGASPQDEQELEDEFPPDQRVRWW